MRFGDAEFAIPEFMKESLELAHLTELPEIVETNEYLNNLSIKCRLDLHIVEEINEIVVSIPTHLIQCVCYPPADVLYGS